MSNDQLQTLQTKTPEEGFELAVKLSQHGVEVTQTSEEIRQMLRPVYARNADSLIAVSQVIAIHFQTIAAANNYWTVRTPQYWRRPPQYWY
ncbi:hexameric tyrosine-coordinated heme protein [Natribacillus halophilus]|uniref:Hexameric tyrosine-coordinated heme protein (HTHP) n=1 Tax=Natribacillus halophilus TaxID=549003 RepID=A0A1G8RPF4_9BACI|nr:hexameric tyrosine-coordinated heme protein [Natribacillus halophilus]SDJ18861.1 Hexameric tyrosine-coordinated heme protein (HTHP) [Natribacillus halophilus]